MSDDAFHRLEEKLDWSELDNVRIILHNILSERDIHRRLKLDGFPVDARVSPESIARNQTTWRCAMSIRLDHTIVPAKDKVASARFFAEIFGLTVKLGYFAQVQINESLTFDFADEPGSSDAPGFDPGRIQSHHYAFHVSDAEFDAIFDRVKAKGLSYGSGPFNHTDGKVYTRRGGRGFYFEDPNGHLLEVMTVPETGS